MNSLSFTILLGLPLLSCAINVPFRQLKLPLYRRSGDFINKPVVNAVVDNGLDLTTVRDLIYMSNMTAGGNNYVVQMDTGSSDVWLKADRPPLTNSQQTSIETNLTFGIGWVYGTVSYIPVQFAGISISSQAYVDVTSANNPALSYNADGLVGLGFTSLSTVDSLVNDTGSTDGRSLLYNLFEDNPDEKNFIAFLFQRSTDSSDDIEGGFSIGEYEDSYKSIADTTPIPTWPVTSPKRWNVLVEAFLIGDDTILPSSAVDNAPGNKGVALLDTGSSYSYVSREICDAIYGGVEGASYDESTGYFNVPCDAEIDMAVQFGGRVFALNPLDINPSSYRGDNSCIGSFVPGTISTAQGQFDYILGVNVLRNMYSLYDFGDFDSNGKMGTPYVQLLSLTDPDEASKAFCSLRGCTAKTGIKYTASDNTYNGPANSVSVSGATAEALEKFSTFFPAMLGIMALNAIVLLGVLILGTVLVCRKCKKRSVPRVPTARMRNTPTPANGVDDHTYEPVSMAITEATMVRPSPAFHQFEGSTLRPGDRPKSLATLPSNSTYNDGCEDALLSPASPGFKQFDMRPRSVGILPSHKIYKKIGEDEPFMPPGKDMEGYPESPIFASSYNPEAIQLPSSPSGSTFRRSPSDETIDSMSALQEALAPVSPSQTVAGAETAALPPSPSIRSFRDSARPVSRLVEGAPKPLPRYVDNQAPVDSRPSSHSVENQSRPSSHYVESGQQRTITQTPVIHLSQPPPVAAGGAGRPSPLNNVFNPHHGEDQDLVPPSASFRGQMNRPRSIGVLPSQPNNPYHPDPRASPHLAPGTLRPLGPNSSNDRPNSMA